MSLGRKLVARDLLSASWAALPCGSIESTAIAMLNSFKNMRSLLRWLVRRIRSSMNQCFAAHELKGSGEERCQLAHRGVHIFGDPISLDMCGVIDFEQLLVFRADCLGECIFAHVEAVRFAACNYQQRLVDQFDLVGGVPTH